MKRVLLICCIIATSGSMALAQQHAQQTVGNHVTATSHLQSSAPSTKVVFQSKISELDADLNHAQIPRAQLVFNDIKRMMGENLSAEKMQIVNAATQAERDMLTAKTQSKWALYSEVIEMSQNLSTNRQAIHTKLVAFLDKF